MLPFIKNGGGDLSSLGEMTEGWNISIEKKDQLCWQYSISKNDSLIRCLLCLDGAENFIDLFIKSANIKNRNFVLPQKPFLLADIVSMNENPMDLIWIADFERVLAVTVLRNEGLL